MWRPGDVVDGRFVLERVAGAGARGSVWRAVDVSLRDAVALKLVGDDDPLASVAGELDALASVHHDAVVGCRAFGRADPHTAYLALTWIDGEPLSARLARRPLSIAGTLALAHRLVDALAAVHAAGLVHGDLKPANVLCPAGDPGAAVLVDLGLTRSAHRSTTEGTPGYMAPELLRGEAADGRADLFALGAVLHEAIAGRVAFAGDTATAVITRVLFEEPAALTREVPPALGALIGALLAKDREARPPDAAAVRARLDEIHAPAVEAEIAIGGDEVRSVSVAVMACAGEPAVEAVAVRRLLGATRVTPLDAAVAATFDGSIATDRAIAAARAAAAMHAATGWAIGLASGPAVIRGELVAGEAVAAATDLAAGAPGVWLDAATAALVSARFDVAGGRLGAERRVEAERTLLGRSSPLVGRDRELNMLTALADEGVAEEAPRVAVITAAPGLGKSRLRRELVRRLASQHTVWQGRGDPVRAGAPLAALADVIRASLEGEASLLDREAVATHVAARGADDPARVADFLSELLGLPDDGRAVSSQLAAARGDPILMNDQLRRAVTDWLAAAARTPLALVLEDFHWGDAPTLRFLEGALRQLRDRPILVIVLGRPQLLEALPGGFAGHHPLTIRLGPLATRAAAQLVRNALPSADDALVDQLVQRAAGNPFFVEELVRQVAHGPAEHSEADEIIALPESVISMVQARLDELAPDERRVLRAASVIGARFRRAAVAALLGLPSADAELQTALGALVGRELLVHRRPSPVAADDELGFAHELVREAASALLTDDDRAAAHRAAAAWWEQRAGADPVALAAHWERGGAPGRAATWHRRAAEVALAANDFSAALAALRRADALGAPPTAAADLIAAEAHAWRGDLPDAAAQAEAAMRRSAPGDGAWWRGLGMAVTARGRLGDHDAVIALATPALAEEPRRDVVAAYLSCMAAVGRQLFHAARYEEGETAIGLVIDHAGDLDELPPLIAAQVHGLLAAAARHRGDLAGDLAGYRAVLASFDAAGDRRNACNTRVSVAFALIELGAWELAEPELARALAEAEHLGLATVATRARQNLGMVWLWRGRLEDAAALLDRVVAEAREQDNLRFAGWSHVYRARVALAQGEPASALGHARHACALLEPSPPALAGARAALALALIASGRPDEAVEAARAAVATVDALGGVEEFEALARLALAEAHHAAGDVAARDAAIARATASLTVRADAIGDPDLRRSFLDDVPENRRTRELAQSYRQGAKAPSPPRSEN